jgi:transcriptional regulator with XRE-family HTH domain
MWSYSGVKTTSDNIRQRKLLGSAIRARRQKIGLSQEKLAEKADVHRNYIGLVERGEQNLTVELLVRISNALGCKPSELLIDVGL